MTDPEDDVTQELDLVAIPPNIVTQADLEQWYVMQEQLKALKASEMLLRRRIFGAYFPSPVEGTNKAQLDGGFVLNGKYPIERKVDIAAFQANRERFQTAHIAADKLVKYEPSLVLSAYRELTAEQQQLFDQCLVVKPGAPALEIVKPKKAKAAEVTGPSGQENL